MDQDDQVKFETFDLVGKRTPSVSLENKLHLFPTCSCLSTDWVGKFNQANGCKWLSFKKSGQSQNGPTPHLAIPGLGLEDKTTARKYVDFS